MSREIKEISNVSINTIAIEVKVIKIGNRQVTLSVFKQLKEEPIINLDTGELQGTPWGRVNYHVGCEGMHTPHMHVVWQKYNELRRSTVFLPWKCVQYNPNIPANFYRTFLYDVQCDFFLFMATSTLENKWVPPSYNRYETLSPSIDIEGISINSDKMSPHRINLLNEVWKNILHPMPTPLGNKINAEECYGWVELTREVEILLSGYWTNYLIGDPMYHDPQTYHDIMEEKIRENIKPKKNRWIESYKRLEGLDQLFIAV